MELHVVLLGDGADRLPEDRFGGDIGHAPPIQVDTGPVFLQRFACALRARMLFPS
jgi:hypothetical protein